MSIKCQDDFKVEMKKLNFVYKINNLLTNFKQTLSTLSLYIKDTSTISTKYVRFFLRRKISTSGLSTYF